MALSNSQTILTDLLLGQATASALAERIPLHEDALAVLCEKHLCSGLVSSHRIADRLTAYRLTESGLEKASTLTRKQPACAIR